MIDLLVCLHRHEHTATLASSQMTARERLALQTRIELVRDTIPRYVLDHYDLLKTNEPTLGECPAALAMATLVGVYRSLPAHDRQGNTSFFDLAGRRHVRCATRGVARRAKASRSLRCRAEHAAC